MTVFSCSGRFGPQVKSLLTPTFGTRSLKSRFKNVKAVEMRDDMVLRGFTEPVYGIAYVGYRTEETNPAVLDLIEWLKGHTHLDETNPIS